MSIVKEFREFALRGNVLDLAVGVIIGAAFGKIIASMIADVILPFVGMFGKADFSNMYVPLTSAVNAEIAKNGGTLAIDKARVAGPVFAYGSFVTEVINFLILAACVFAVIKLFNTARKRFEAQKPAPAPAGPTVDQQLLIEIRDLMAKR